MARPRFSDFTSNTDVLVASWVGPRQRYILLRVFHKARGCWSDWLELPQLQHTDEMHLVAFVEPRLLLVITSKSLSFHAHLLRASDACDSFSHVWSRLLITSRIYGSCNAFACGLYGTTSRLWFVVFDNPVYKIYDVDNVLDEKAEVQLKVPAFSLDDSLMIAQCVPYGNFLYMVCRSDETFSTELQVLNFANEHIEHLPEFAGNGLVPTCSALCYNFFKNRIYASFLDKNCVRSAVFDLERRVWTTSETFLLCTVPNAYSHFYKLVILPGGEALVETETTSCLDAHTNRYAMSAFIEPPTLLDLAYRIIHTRMPSKTRRLLDQSDVAKPHELVNALL